VPMEALEGQWKKGLTSISRGHPAAGLPKAVGSSSGRRAGQGGTSHQHCSCARSWPEVPSQVNLIKLIVPCVQYISTFRVRGRKCLIQDGWGNLTLALPLTLGGLEP